MCLYVPAIRIFLNSIGGKKPVEVHAAVWVPDNEATICMHCNKTQFTVLNRRVHTYIHIYNNFIFKSVCYINF